MKYFIFVLISFLLLPVAIQAQTVATDSLIQAEGTTAVYYLASDGKRYVFPNQKTFNTWYEDFSQVQLITLEQLGSYPIGGNITYRPGTRLIKITTDPKTYAVEPGGVLRHIASEEVAKGLYGDNWATLIDDVADTFFINYQLDEVRPIDSLEHPLGSLIKYSGSEDVFLVIQENEQIVKRKINNLDDNDYRSEYVLSIANTISYVDGTGIVNKENSLFNPLATRLSDPVTDQPDPEPIVKLDANSIFIDSRSTVTADGSLEAPYRTIADGLSNLAAGQALYLRGGANGTQYTYNEIFSFPAQGGSTDSYKWVKAYPGELVTIALSNTLTIGSDWWKLSGFTIDKGNQASVAIQLGGSNIILDDMELTNGQDDGIVFLSGASHNTINNSKIHSFGLDCIEISKQTSYISVTNSEIYNCINDALEIQAAPAPEISHMPSNITISGNSFYAGDAGGFRGINLMGTISTTISGNTFGQFLTDAIEVAGLPQNVDIIGNKIFNSVNGIEVKSSAGNTPRNIDIFNNVIYDIIGSYALSFDGVEALRVTHNTLFDIDSSPFKVGSIGIASGQIRNNLISNSGANLIEQQAQKAVVSYNGWFDGASSSGLGGSNNTEGEDPKFVASANNDFHLMSDSQAVDAGTELTYILTDFDGNLRAVGAEPDLGAFEVQ